MTQLASISGEAASESDGTPDQNNDLFMLPLVPAFVHQRVINSGGKLRAGPTSRYGT